MNGPDEHTRGCARCDWNTTGTRLEVRADAETHATATGHLLCCICHRSLERGVEQTCPDCVTRVRERLADILVLYALLPAELEHARADDALVMGSPGGLAQAIHVAVPDGMTWQEFVDANPDWWHTTAHGLQLPSDPESVSQTLGQWEDDWRGMRGTRPITVDGPTVNLAAGRNTWTVSGTTAYMNINMSWAADNHPAFPYFAADVRRLHRRLENATATGERPDRDEVDCFDCGQERLEREFAPANPCQHKPPLLAWPPTENTPWAPVEPVVHYAERDRVWRRGHSCDQGGRRDLYVCAACGRRYTPAEYWLARKALYETAVSAPRTRPVVTVRIHPHDTPLGIDAYGLCPCGSPMATVTTTVTYPDGDVDEVHRVTCAATRTHNRRTG